MGAHILCIKDMADFAAPMRRSVGPGAAGEVGLPIHFHTHDASGVQAATLVKGGEAGIDIIDAAVAAVSGPPASPISTPSSARFRNRTLTPN